MPRRLVMLCIVSLVTLAGCAVTAPGDHSAADTDRGYEALKNGQYAEAASYYERALGVDPEEPYSVLNLGVAYENLGRAERARAQYIKAISVGEGVYPERRFDARFADEADLRGALTIADMARSNLAAMGYRTSVLPRLRATVH